MKERVLVCVAWPYANGPLHLGHVAGSLLPPDVFARYHRLRGHDVAMVSGSDMHGTPITVAAEKVGETPEAFAEKNRVLHNEALRALSIHFDLFTSTATANHRRVVQEIFLGLQRNGYIEQGTMTAPYDPKAKRFLPDRYVEGTCPHCGFPDARGDQCDNCGRTLDPQELKSPRSKLTGAPPEYRETRHFFLRLDKLQPLLQSWVDDGNAQKHGPWRPSVEKFTRQWLAEGLKSRAITRDLTYGVPLPTEAGEFPDKRIYVWFEAVVGYLSATVEWSKAHDRDWRDYWDPKHHAKHYYFLGKDNIPFHTIIWPGMLLGYNDSKGDRHAGELGALQLPWDVPANEFLQFAGAKFSKSRGNAFYVLDLLQHFSADQVRYYLTVNMPEKGDTDWTWPDFVAKVNDELADTLGNYVNRVLSFTKNNFADAAPAGPAKHAPDLDALVEARLLDAASALERCEFKESLRAVMQLARLGNQSFNDLKPWDLVKHGKKDEAGAALLWHLGLIKTLSVALQPFLPTISEDIWRQLGEPGDSPRAIAERGNGMDHWPKRLLAVKPTQPLGVVKPLVRKLELKAVLEEFQSTASQETTPVTQPPTTTPTPPPAAAAGAIKPTVTTAGRAEDRDEGRKPLVTIDDFVKLDLRVARVLSCEPHPKADKIWVLQVDIGTETRQILAGLREHVKPDELVGRNIVVIANLQPRQIRGLESQGMVLAAEAGGIVAPLMPAKDIAPGAGIK